MGDEIIITIIIIIILIIFILLLIIIITTRWQLLNEEIDCTEEEMLLFASLQLQVALQANVPQPKDEPEDDIESALNELQISLDGGYPNRAEDITLLPQLNGYLKYLKPRRFTLKGYKTSYFVCKDLQLSSWKSREDSTNLSMEPAFSINLKGCEVAPEVNIHQGRYKNRKGTEEGPKISNISSVNNYQLDLSGTGSSSPCLLPRECQICGSDVSLRHSTPSGWLLAGCQKTISRISMCLYKQESP